MIKYMIVPSLKQINKEKYPLASAFIEFGNELISSLRMMNELTNYNRVQYNYELEEILRNNHIEKNPFYDEKYKETSVINKYSCQN